MAATDSVRGAKPRLINGTEMTCPRCKKPRNILDFQRMQDNKEFAHELAVIYKCPPMRGGCGFFFAPTDHSVALSMLPANVSPEEVRFE